MSNRIRHSSPEYQRNTFYQLPKFLMSEEFDDMSYGAKFLFTLLRDRHSVSIENGWENDKGDIYLIMSREEMCDLLKVSLKTIIKLINELKKFELLEEDRRGLGMTNLIYLLEVKTCKKYTHRPVKSTGQDVEKLQGSNTNSSNTEFNNISLSVPVSKEKIKKPANKENRGSFDTQEFVELALKRSSETDKKADKK